MEKSDVDTDQTVATEVETAEVVAIANTSDTGIVTEEIIEPAAENPATLYESGLTEMNNKNFGSAVSLFQSAAARGDPLAQYQLGSLYYQVTGIKQDYEAAALWYRRAAEQGNIDAQYSLGNMYLMGEGIQQDDGQARHWYEQAANQSHTAATHNLENLSRLNTAQTTNIVTDVATAVAINSEPAEPMQALPDPATETETGISGSTTTNEVNSAPVAVVDYERGLAYAFGETVPKDLQAAFNLFKQSAEAGYAAAQYKLGVAYAYGEGTTIDLSQSLYWYQKAARQGHPIAQRNLGLMYQNGEGTEQNKPLALAWYSLLADRGNVMDVQRHASLSSELSDEENAWAEQLKQELLSEMPSNQN